MAKANPNIHQLQKAMNMTMPLTTTTHDDPHEEADQTYDTALLDEENIEDIMESDIEDETFETEMMETVDRYFEDVKREGEKLCHQRWRKMEEYVKVKEETLLSEEFTIENVGAHLEETSKKRCRASVTTPKYLTDYLFCCLFLYCFIFSVKRLQMAALSRNGQFNVIQRTCNLFVSLQYLYFYIWCEYLSSQTYSIRRKRGGRSGRKFKSRYTEKPIPVLRSSQDVYVLGAAAEHTYTRNSSISKWTNRQRCGRNRINPSNLIRIPSLHISYDSQLECRFALWNAHSILKNNCTTAIIDLIVMSKLDFIAITETWLKDCQRDIMFLADLENALPDFNILHSPRAGMPGGGVCVILRKGFKVDVNRGMDFASFEHMDITVECGGKLLRVIIIYRPPPSKKNRLIPSLFYEEFSQMIELESLVTRSSKLLILGDFNIHVDSVNDHEACKFLGLLQSSNLCQMVVGPTHMKGHTLDLVISSTSENLISDIRVDSSLPSDHFAVVMKVKMRKPSSSRVTVTSRKIRNINVNLFMADINKSQLVVNASNELENLTHQYYDVLSGLLDRHAPKITRIVKLRPHTPWYYDHLRMEKRKNRRCERKWLKTRLEIDRQIYKECCINYHRLLDQAKINYYRDQLASCNSRELFFKVKKMSYGTLDRVLPSGCEQAVANRFMDFFTEKIDNLRNAMKYANYAKVNIEKAEKCKSSMCYFKPLTYTDIRKIIMQAPTKSCLLDPIPTSLLKECIDLLLPSITKITNFSLVSGIVPCSLKSAVITPKIKKPGLNRDGLNNYRPISNVPFLGKIIERAVLLQLQRYLDENNLETVIQSAYKQNHSTETALIRVQNDILRAVDAKSEVAVVLLDLTAAFDTIDHTMLLDRLENMFGIDGVVLNWVNSYLSDRKQRVVLGGFSSPNQPLIDGVPQGSVIGPKLFALYFGALSLILDAHEVKGMMYADDTQLYVSFNSSMRGEILKRLEACIYDISSWLRINKLMLNSDKTEVLHVSSHFQHSEPLPPIQIGPAVINATPKVRDLGVVYDNHLVMSSHVTKLCQAANLALRNIGQLRRFLDQPTTERLVHAFISSRIDYCNSLLYGLPNTEISKLQRIQNSAARVVCRAPKWHDIGLILRKLHWLPVCKRILFKMLLLVYKSLNGLAPEYINDLLKPYIPTRTLRSSKLGLLRVPQAASRTCSAYGDRAFSIAAPREWNKLPESIRKAQCVEAFKNKLKTYLFNL